MRRREFIALSLTVPVMLHAARAAAVPDSQGTLVLYTASELTVARAVGRTLRETGESRTTALEIVRGASVDGRSLSMVMRTYGGCRLLALLDDATDTLLHECLREEGARVLCTGHHAAATRGSGSARHDLWLSSTYAESPRLEIDLVLERLRESMEEHQHLNSTIACL